MTNRLETERHRLIQVHKARYLLHAQALLDGCKQIKIVDELVTYQRPNRNFVERIEAQLPPRYRGEAGRQILVNLIGTEADIPELDEVLCRYVGRLTGQPA